MSDAPLVSVIVTTYNQEDTLPQALDSVLAQECAFPFEVVVGEDCSTDRTREVCLAYRERYPDRVRLLLNERNKGVVDNYFDCLLACRGKYVADCAGDDYWTDPAKLRKEVAVLEADATVSVVHTNWMEWDVSRGVMVHDGRGSHGGGKKRRTKGADLLLPIVTQTSLQIIHLNTACYRKEAVMRRYAADTRLFRSKLWHCEDIPVAFALCLEGDVVFLDEETLVYRVGQDSLSTAADPRKRFRFVMGVTELSHYLSSRYGVRGREVDAYFHVRYHELLMYVFRDRDAVLAREVARLSARLGVPFSFRERCLYAAILHDALYRPAKLLRDGVVRLKRRLRR